MKGSRKRCNTELLWFSLKKFMTRWWRQVYLFECLHLHIKYLGMKFHTTFFFLSALQSSSVDLMVQLSAFPRICTWKFNTHSCCSHEGFVSRIDYVPLESCWQVDIWVYVHYKMFLREAHMMLICHVYLNYIGFKVWWNMQCMPLELHIYGFFSSRRRDGIGEGTSSYFASVNRIYFQFKFIARKKIGAS